MNPSDMLTALRRQPLSVAFLVTLAVTAAAYLLPGDYAATAVGGIFFLATYYCVLRGPLDLIRRHGLGMGGLFEPDALETSAIAHSFLRASYWLLIVAALTFPAFVLGYQYWFDTGFAWRFRLGESPLNEILGQVLAVALPEEMFYRGYLQSALDARLGTPVVILGAQVGWGLVVASAIFALGHVATTPHVTRLAVFFPSLVFGWLRARSGGIGAGVLYHAACNLLSAGLARGFAEG